MKYIRDESVMTKTQKFDADNKAWAAEHLSRWRAAGFPAPDGLTLLAMRTLRRLDADLEGGLFSAPDGAVGDSQEVSGNE